MIQRFPSYCKLDNSPTSPFSFILQLTFFYTIMAMALSPRDAIAISDIERYDSFMAEVDGSQFLDMHFDNTGVKIDVYEYPSSTLFRSAHFEPSPKADSYFEQQKAHADEILGEQLRE
ncbi:hypothetical protein FLAG1_10253 [Fusarium langsethiae]|uniref:Uncharacterized protein n=1 Tax=Fusarium langsethiae TaxID=179993 RepID=A0A0N0V5E7_FUSLA|nr:hypothetical protein FLAG1_10253 [Fusarium langsethiae]